MKITTIKAFIATDASGDEGVCGFMKPDGQWLPMVCADDARVDSLRPLAEKIAKATGKIITLSRFSVREDLEVFGGKAN